MEKDIILLATTITHAGTFATDAQRVNVALTRARHHLIVLGSSGVLRSCSAAFKLLLSSCQMLPGGACLVLPSSLSNKSNMRSSRTTSACAAEEHDSNIGIKHQSDVIPAQCQDSADAHGQASACSYVRDDSQLSNPAQNASGSGEGSAAVLAGAKGLSPPGQVRGGCPAVERPHQAVVRHLNQAVPSINATQVAAPPVIFDIDDI